MIKYDVIQNSKIEELRMINASTRKMTTVVFLVVLLILIAIFAASLIKTDIYNRQSHSAFFTGSELFNPDEARTDLDVYVTAAARTSTWGKIFDFYNEGLTENNYQAYTYDFTVTNNSKDEVLNFTFKLEFSHEVFLASAWNGELEIHQVSADKTDKIPDLREFHPENHDLEIFSVEGDHLVVMEEGDYLIYHPSHTVNAMEMPIEPYKATTPGIILYVKMGESMEQSTIELDYKLHRFITTEPLFWVSVIAASIWLIALIIFVLTAAQVRKYQLRHERDNEIINESIETFTGFIDAKDPYTNGHSKRVATYTKMIAKELGYEGEELDRIYYIALLHDCGKIGVPDSILGKPGKLTDEEFEIIKSHTTRGWDILSSFKSLKNVGEGALYHHERYDGKGYPKGKAGEEIPLIARIICVADSFDAMNTNRVYRKRLTREQIISELERNKGLQFDPKLADIMLGLIRDNKIKIDRS